MAHVTVLCISLISLFAATTAKISGVYTGGSWETAYATFYGGNDAFDTIDKHYQSTTVPILLQFHFSPNRFTSTESVEKVTKRVKEVRGRLRYGVKEVKGGGAIGLGKGKVGLVFEVLEIAEKLVVVEVVAIVIVVVVRWRLRRMRELKEGLEDVVLQWHNGVPCDE